MRYKKAITVGAIAALVGVSSPFWWPTQAQGTNMTGFKRYAPEEFFSGQQLMLAQAIHDGDLARVQQLAHGLKRRKIFGQREGMALGVEEVKARGHCGAGTQ